MRKKILGTMVVACMTLCLACGKADDSNGASQATVESESEKYAEFYGGEYINDSGDYVILLTNMDEEIKNYYKKTVDEEVIIFEKCERSYAELDAVLKDIDAKWEANKDIEHEDEAVKDLFDSFRRLAVDVMDGVVEVGLKDCTDEKIQLFKEHVSDYEYIEFQDTEGMELHDN